MSDSERLKAPSRVQRKVKNVALYRKYRAFLLNNMYKALIIISLLLSTITPVYAEENLNNEINKTPEQIKISSLHVDEIFPFSLPWDFYNFMEIVKAEPKAPDVKMNLLVVPAVLGMEEQRLNINIDLMRYEKEVVIFRSIELFTFCVALVYLTKTYIL